MEGEIQKNFVYLCENISNVAEILLHFIQLGIISQDERDQIIRENVRTSEKNKCLLDLLQKKDWNRVRSIFTEILQKTNNQHCVDEIERKSIQSTSTGIKLHPKISKWWPGKKNLIKFLYERKHGDKFVVEELHKRILQDERRMVVLCDSANVGKYSAMGGVGKTLTAKWYAHHYEEEYDHILWINCGEGSLVQSFKSLAKDLDNVKFLNEHVTNVEEFARKSFESLSEFKCLWIYDNAESYKGKEGIINVLWKGKENFFCLITSRSREWGVEDIGYEKISDLELDIFSEEESVEFLREKLNKEIKSSDLELRELSRLLGNLPMAMELALASLNGKKMEVTKYMQKLREKDLRVLDATFDKYQETINKNIKISIEEILEEDEGKLALEIFMIFGYIRPDDIPQQFFEEIFSSQVDKSIDLLVRHSLISKEKRNGENNFLNIHRLLQQVIRHNGRQQENDSLRKIFGCKGFTEYKLMPFTKYADGNLRKEFPKVNAELLDQEQLTKLLKERRFDECVHLADFLHQQLKTKTTKFNHAICMGKNGQLEECVKSLEELYEQKTKERILYRCGFETVQMGMLRLDKKVSRELIGGHLLVAYCTMDEKQTKEILQKRKQFQIIYSLDDLHSLNSLIRLLCSDLINSKYSLTCGNSFIQLRLNVGTKKIELMQCPLSLNHVDRLSPEELSLTEVSFFRDGQELEEMRLNDFVDLISMKRLTLKYPYSHRKSVTVTIELSGDASMEYLRLQNVRVLNWNSCNWNVKQLELLGIPFLEKTNMEVQEINFDDASLDVSCLPKTVQKLTCLTYTDYFLCTVSGGVELPNLQFLILQLPYVDCLSHFRSLPLLTHVHFCGIREGNVDLLPPSVTHLKITKTQYRNAHLVGGVRKIEKLILWGFSFQEMQERLTHLQTDNLVYYNHYEIEANELQQLANKKIKTIAAGKIKWTIVNSLKAVFKIHPTQLNRKADYYIFEGGKGRGMNYKEFKELMKLF